MMLRIAATLALLATIAAPASAQSNLRSLRGELEALDSRITRLEDIAAVERVQRSYSYYVDKSQFRETADLFAEDGILEIGGRGRFLGRERAFEYLDVGLGGDGMRQGVLQDHQSFSPIVTIAPDGEHAEARVAAHVVAGGGGASGIWGDVTYENSYVKRDGVWQFTHLRARFNMYAMHPVGWVDNAVPNTRPESFLPPPDLPPSALYMTYPNYYVEPYHYPNPVTGEPMPQHDPAAGGTAFGRDD